MLEFNFVYKRSYSCFKVYYMQYAWHLLYLMLDFDVLQYLLRTSRHMFPPT